MLFENTSHWSCHNFRLLIWRKFIYMFCLNQSKRSRVSPYLTKKKKVQGFDRLGWCHGIDADTILSLVREGNSEIRVTSRLILI